MGSLSSNIAITLARLFGPAFRARGISLVRLLPLEANRPPEAGAWVGIHSEFARRVQLGRRRGLLAVGQVAPSQASESGEAATVRQEFSDLLDAFA